MALMSRTQKKLQKGTTYLDNRSTAKEHIFAYINGSLEVKDHGTHTEHWGHENLDKAYRGVYNRDSKTVRLIAPRPNADYSKYTIDDLPNRLMCKIYDSFGADVNLLIY